jgi:hypothetical protein
MNVELDPRETTMISNVGPISSGPASSGRHRSPLREVIDSLHGLSLSELADVFRYVHRVRASRGDRPSPEFVSRLIAVVSRLSATYPVRVPISLVRAHFATVPRNLVEQALFEAEARHLLRLETVDLPTPFVEVSAGIQHARGLLYWIVPTNQ